MELVSMYEDTATIRCDYSELIELSEQLDGGDTVTVQTGAYAITGEVRSLECDAEGIELRIDCDKIKPHNGGDEKPYKWADYAEWPFPTSIGSGQLQCETICMWGTTLPPLPDLIDPPRRSPNCKPAISGLHTVADGRYTGLGFRDEE